MATINIPCVADEIIYYPARSHIFPIHLRVTEIRITRYGAIVEAINDRTEEIFRFPEIYFGETVFAGEEGRKQAYEICEKRRNQQAN